ncbi:hypothetical protein [Natronococcus sp. A-GB7]|jgi:hypothetical protein|uniref:hypothetical protein n=1 Tax=Natronococcus sp. A-GB7 TaxID=3037649 RepID=UPI00241E5358|nr:hypothetical protein [Natronococcus sp. A-GB7]MDG5821142.1 hypothetical protein [Natronococcus sp. A-GB7]
MRQDASDRSIRSGDADCRRHPPEVLRMKRRNLQLLYAGGIALNAVALIAAATTGSTLYAATFGLVIVYLSVRYWMVSKD